MPEKITHESFESLVGKTVSLKAGDDSFEAKVDAVHLLSKNSDQPRQPYSVELLADTAENHGQQIFELSHPELGDLSLFMVPLGPENGGWRYEIVFN